MTFIKTLLLWLLLRTDYGEGAYNAAGSQAAAPGQFPYITALVDPPDFVCSAVIISDQWLITTGRCVQNKDHQKLHIRTEIIDVNYIPADDSKLLQIKQIVVHPKFYADDVITLHDLALIQLVAPLQFSTTLRAILPGQVNDKNAMVMSAGWGEHDGLATMLRYKLFHTVAVETCELRRGVMHAVAKDGSEICLERERNSAPCKGYAGAALIKIQTAKLVGIFSRKDDCNAYLPRIYVKMAKYVGWINNVTGLALAIVD